jgi:hypothetical protein
MLSEASYHNMTVGRIPSVEGGIQPTIVDAKGDLIAAVAADSLNRLAVGSNDQVLVADSAASTGLAWKSYGAQVVAGKNAVINGGMDIWQRGTSITGTSGIPYTADRWQVTRVGATGYTITRQSSGATLPEIQYCLRAQRDSGNTNTTLLGAFYSVESVNSIPFAGKTSTLSFYIRAGANYSGGAVTVEFSQGTGTDQNIISGGFTGKTNVGSSSVTLTTSWQRVTITGTVATTTTQLGLQFYYTPTGTAGAADYFEITGVQLELGSTATPFSRAGGTIQGELAACQRYYRRWTAGTAYGTLSMFGTGLSSTQAICAVPIMTMRVTPTSVDYANINAGDGTNSYAVTALSLNQGNENAVWLLATTASGLVQYRPTSLVGSNNTAGFIGLSAEL